MTPEILEAWGHLTQSFGALTGADRQDARDLLSLHADIGTLEFIDVDNDVVGYLNRDNPLDVTVWWRQSTKLFYLGVVGDDDGSITSTIEARRFEDCET